MSLEFLKYNRFAAIAVHATAAHRPARARKIAL